MSNAIAAGNRVASLLAERVKGKVYLCFFNESPTFLDVTGLSLTQIEEKTRRITASGCTSIGCGLDYLRSKSITVDGIAIVSDGGDNANPYFHAAYKKYTEALDIEPTVYFYLLEGSEGNALTSYLKGANITFEQFNLGNKVDYYALPGLIETMRVNRFSLVDEIMDTPLLTFAKVFETKEDYGYATA